MAMGLTVKAPHRVWLTAPVVLEEATVTPESSIQGIGNGRQQRDSSAVAGGCAIEEVGSSSPAAVPLVLEMAMRAGCLRPGDLVLLSAYGGGMTWASMIHRWQSAT
jgi:hypothetical protein